jgi:hypothetical protein
MDAGRAFEFILRILGEPDLLEHIETVGFSSSGHKWKVEAVPVIRGNHSWSSIAKVCKETAYYGGLSKELEPQSANFESHWGKTDLIELIKDSKLPLVFRSWRVLEIIDIFADDFSIGNEESLLKLSAFLR